MNLKKIHLILFLKPYYNWNAFNTKRVTCDVGKRWSYVLNLVISGLPSIPIQVNKTWKKSQTVLNLVISGMPSILWSKFYSRSSTSYVLNLVISGMPSIPAVVVTTPCESNNRF